MPSSLTLAEMLCLPLVRLCAVSPMDLDAHSIGTRIFRIQGEVDTSSWLVLSSHPGEDSERLIAFDRCGGGSSHGKETDGRRVAAQGVRRVGQQGQAA